MVKRFKVKVYESVSSEDADLLSMYDMDTMMYQCICRDTGDTKELLDETVSFCNGLDSEIKQLESEIATLKQYMGRGEHELMKENIKLRNMLRYQEGVYGLEKKYFRECLLSMIEEYPKSSGLLAFKDVVGW